jgi:hypothetical protein
MAKLAPKNQSGDNKGRIAGHCLSGGPIISNDAARQESGGCLLPHAALEVENHLHISRGEEPT